MKESRELNLNMLSTGRQMVSQRPRVRNVDAHTHARARDPLFAMCSAANWCHSSRQIIQGALLRLDGLHRQGVQGSHDENQGRGCVDPVFALNLEESIDSVSPDRAMGAYQVLRMMDEENTGIQHIERREELKLQSVYTFYGLM